MNRHITKYDCSFKEKYINCQNWHSIKHAKLEKAGINKRFQKIDFNYIVENIIPDQVKCQYLSILDYKKDLIENIENGEGLIMLGSVGTMKTTFAIALLVEYLLNFDGSGFFISMPCLLDKLFSLKAKDPVELYNFEKKIKTSRLLVIDDLGAEHTASWVLTKVDSIISERYSRQLASIITTNLSKEQLKKTYAERIIDRLRSTSKIIVFNGESLRGKRVQIAK